MFDRIHAFESNTRATVQKQIGRLLGGLQRGLGFILYDGELRLRANTGPRGWPRTG